MRKINQSQHSWDKGEKGKKNLDILTEEKKIIKEKKAGGKKISISRKLLKLEAHLSSSINVLNPTS